MATLKDIAKAAKVSIPAVSSVLNERSGSIRVGTEARRRIIEAADRLNYIKNDLARSVQNGVSNFIAFVDVRAGESEHSNRILDGVVAALQATEYFPKFFPYGNDRDAIGNINTLFGQRPAGVLAIARSSEYMERIGSLCLHNRIPQVTVGHSNFFGNEIVISTEDRTGQAEAVEYLHKLGHRRIGHLRSGDDNMVYSRRRAQGYIDGMNKCSLSENIAVLSGALWCGMDVNTDLDLQIRDFIKAHKLTALTCVTDFHAMVATRAVWRMGLRVPEDISIIGHANFSCCEFSNPPLTSIAEPFEQMGRLAANELLDCIRNQRMTSKREIKLPTSLIERKSVAKIKT